LQSFPKLARIRLSVHSVQQRHLREQDKKVLSDQQRAAILSLATDFPRLWRDANTPDRERKRMIRLLLEDVTLVRGEKGFELGDLGHQSDADEEVGYFRHVIYKLLDSFKREDAFPFVDRF
jgi:hypothetical protein